MKGRKYDPRGSNASFPIRGKQIFDGASPRHWVDPWGRDTTTGGISPEFPTLEAGTYEGKEATRCLACNKIFTRAFGSKQDLCGSRDLMHDWLNGTGTLAQMRYAIMQLMWIRHKIRIVRFKNPWDRAA